jgi:AraC-like DNA-binding protein
MGFNDFVNTFRVNAVIEKINRQEYLTKNITTLAEEAGFRSKSTFHTAFKKITGKTPKEYKTQH